MQQDDEFYNRAIAELKAGEGLRDQDKELLSQLRMGQSQVMGMGGKDERSAGFSGRGTYRKQLDKDSEIEAYLEGMVNKSKGFPTKGEITGGGVRYTKRFNKGGKVKTSKASKRADGCCTKGKTKGRMI